MRTVWKFPLGEGSAHFTAPAPARPIHAGLDPTGEACVWVEVDDDSPFREERDVVVTGTGTPIPDGAVHIGSFNDNPFVWHVWDVTEYPF